MRTYRELFQVREFVPLFLNASVQAAAITVSGLAMGTLVYAKTGSPLLSALAMFGPSLAQALGAMTLLSMADRVPPRVALTGLPLLIGLATAAQAVPGLPVWGAFVLLLANGVVASLGSGVHYGLLHEILPKDGYMLGRSVLSMATGITQIFGYALGGVLVAAVSPRGTVLIGAALCLTTAAIARIGLVPRPARSDGRTSVPETWRNNRTLWSSRSRRHLYLALWLPNGLIVGCESLFVPYTPERAGALLTCSALGMLLGDILISRFAPPGGRDRLAIPLCLLLAVPYLAFAAKPPLVLAGAIVFAASIGFASSLLLQQRLVDLTPHEMSGQALGLYFSGMLGMQGVGAALAGTVAQLTSTPVAIAAMGAFSIAVTVTLGLLMRADRQNSARSAAARSLASH